MNDGIPSASVRSAVRRRLTLPRRAAAVAVGGAVMGLVIAAGAFRPEPEVAVVAMIPPQTLERSDVPETSALVNVLDHTLTPEEELASCRATLRSVAGALGMAVDDNADSADSADSRTVKERQEACTDLLAAIEKSITTSGELAAHR